MNEEYRRLFTDIDELVNFLSSLPIRSDIYFSFNKVLYAIDYIGKDKDVVIIKTKKEKCKHIFKRRYNRRIDTIYRK